MRGPAQLEPAEGSAIGRVFVRDPLCRSHALPLQQLAHELTSSLRVALGLEEHIQDLAFCIHSPPKIHLLTTNTNAHLIEVPASVWFRASGPQPSGDHRTEGEHPAPDALV